MPVTTTEGLHVAIIMDGNGRWAVARGLPRIAGHKRGADVVHDIVAGAPAAGVSALTIFAFSTENWRRPKKEVDYILHLFVKTVEVWMPELVAQHVRVRIIGDRMGLSARVQGAISAIESRTAQECGLHLNVALNYGGRAEILFAAQSFAADCVAGRTQSAALDEQAFQRYLWLGDEKAPDIVVRTGAEQRISNFLLWELAYAELFFVDTLWPDFTVATLSGIVDEYRTRRRRFGGL